MERTAMGRREAMALLGAAGAALAAGCSSPTSPTATGSFTSEQTGGLTCAVTPSETAGPFPSLNTLIRSDIREGRSGTPVTLTISVVDARDGCHAVENAQVEIWQCDAAGNYSEYGSERGQTYLRGIQTTDTSGMVTFTTVYPGWYQGRATHIHVEVSREGSPVKVTQIAFPDATNAAVYATGVYAPRGSNPISNARDSIFANSLDEETASVSGDPASGMTATFRVAIAA